MEYTIVYSKRKSIAICVKSNGEVIVKSPKYVSKKIIDDFVNSKSEWIYKVQGKIKNSLQNKIVIDSKKELELKKKAVESIDKKVRYYSKLIDVEPRKIVIGNARSYWGYCDIKNNINFSWRLMLASDKAIDYVVVHELTHIKHPNHSKKFWSEVEKIIPDYKVLKKELNELAKKF